MSQHESFIPPLSIKAPQLGDRCHQGGKGQAHHAAAAGRPRGSSFLHGPLAGGGIAGTTTGAAVHIQQHLKPLPCEANP